ncbi:MAG TPA: hypothetical protein VMM37_01625 [Bacteroidota bacterium]|nr:hypothetical protein [Bacteroidota bacterium]
MSALRKEVVNEVCPHCSHKIKWAWVIRYESPRFVRLVHLCSHCERVLKTEEEKTKRSGVANPGSILMPLI